MIDWSLIMKLFSSYPSIGHKEKKGTCKSYILKVNPQTLFAYHIRAPDKLRICIFYAMKWYSWNIAESSVNQSKSLNCIGGVMVSVLASSAVDRGFEPLSGQTKDY